MFTTFSQIGRQMGWLAAGLVLALALWLMIESARSSSPPTWRDDAMSALVIWVAGSLGLVVSQLPTSAQGRISALLAGLALRMSLPLAALTLSVSAEQNAAATSPWLPAGGSLVFFYLVGLAVEIPLIVRSPACSGAAAAPGEGPCP